MQRAISFLPVRSGAETEALMGSSPSTLRLLEASVRASLAADAAGNVVAWAEGNVYTTGMFPSQSSEDASFFVAKYAPLSP
jgi:hypothetical protein